MKKCAYCGHQNHDAAELCSGCGTNEFKASGSSEASGARACLDPIRGTNGPHQKGLRMFALVCLTISALYGPSIIASVLTHDRWADKLARVRFWPSLPGLGLLLMLPRLKWTEIDGACATSALGFVMFVWMVRFRNRPAVAVLPILIISLALGVFVYGGFAM